jgi:Spy/CpxP family protein refolding chaperone
MKLDTKKILGILSATALALGIAGAAFARPGGGGIGGPWARLIRSLDLSEEQAVQATRLFHPIRQDARQVRRERRENRAMLAEELGKEAPDAEALHRFVEEAAKERTRLAHRAVDAFLELHRGLTPDQRQMLVDRLQKAGRRGPGR